ncbi:MAG TPA: hypothetical protein VGF38_06645 [Ktedonobacterales bacterium]|jgi:hypothetical protein
MRKLLVACIACVVMTLLVGCAQPSSGQHSPTVSGIPIATTQPTPVATHGALTSGHPCETDASGQVSYVQFGDLKVSQAHFTLAYPSLQLPSDLDGSKPYKLPANAYDPPSLPVNPNVGSGAGYGLTVCNTSSTASHIIAGVTVSISAFQPYSGQLNVWQFCDSVYARPDGLGGGGCGGANVHDESLQATFAANATTGALVTATLVGSGATSEGSESDAPPLPISLGPGQMLIFSMGITPPIAAGTYSFAFGLNYDAVTAAPISTMQPTLFDTLAQKWNGQNCTSPTLLSQIPTTVTNPPTNYVCA